MMCDSAVFGTVKSALEPFAIYSVRISINFPLTSNLSTTMSSTPSPYPIFAPGWGGGGGACIVLKSEMRVGIPVLWYALRLRSTASS